MTRAALVSVVAAALAVPSSARAQQAVPGTAADVVQLDAVVTDADGRPVRGLRLEDFQLLEDGKAQRLTHFTAAGAEPPPSPGDLPPPERAEPEPPAGAPRRIVVVVDDLHIALRGLDDAKNALRRLLDEGTSPDDEVALVTTSGGVVHQLTRDRAVVKAAVTRLSSRDASVAPARGSQMTAEQAALILRGDRSAVELATGTIVNEPGSLYSGASPQAALAAPPGEAGAAGGAGITAEARDSAAEKEIRRQAEAVLAEALRFSSATTSVLEDVVRGLAPHPGRKVCILVSDGFLDGSGTRDERAVDLRRVIDAATRSGTVVYTLDAGGLSSGADAGSAGLAVAPGLEDRVHRKAEQILGESLLTLASSTGGFLVRGTNDLASGLRRMLDDNAAYYVLAYEPDATRRDGRFRKIELRVPGHRDWRVRTRAGYFAPDDRKREARPAVKPPPAAGAIPTLDERAARAALAEALAAHATALPVRLSADFVALDATGAQVVVNAHVDLARAAWTDGPGRRRADVDIVGGLYDAQGAPVGSVFGRQAQVEVAIRDQPRALAQGLTYRHVQPLAPGRYEVRLLARQPGGGLAGIASQAVEVPDLAGRALALSGVFLAASGTGELAAADAIRAQAVRRFRRDSSIDFQLYAYNVTDAAAVLQAQVWSPGGKTLAASKPVPLRLERKDGVVLPETNTIGLAGLEPGAYELRVVVVDRKANATATRRLDFAIE
ncbi:MAG: VWA domain-containing protein [Vicinamibacteria bacterium]